MKNLILLLLIAPTLLHAQLAKSFESSRPDVYKPLADIFLRTSAASNTVEKIDTLDNGKYRVTYLSNGSRIVEIHMQYSKTAKPAGDMYAITSIKASFSLLFPFWKQYFEPDASKEATTAHEHGIAYSLKKADGHEKVFSFGKDEVDQINWMVRVKDY